MSTMADPQAGQSPSSGVGPVCGGWHFLVVGPPQTQVGLPSGMENSGSA
jgi:hypothetical protein